MQTRVQMDEDRRKKFGDEAPTWIDFILVYVAVGLLIALSWIAWFKLGWFH